MGSCNSKKLDKQPRLTSENCGKRVNDLPRTPLFESPSELTFRVSFSHIKARNLPITTGAYVVIEVPKVFLTKTNIIEQTPHPQWKLFYEEEIKLSLSEMKKTWIRLKIMNSETESPFGCVEINILEAATGPSTNEFNLDPLDTSKKGPRVSFDFHVIQKLSITYRINKVSFCLEEELTDKDYNFSFRLISHHSDFTSDHSDLRHNTLFPQRNGSTRVVTNQPVSPSLPKSEEEIKSQDNSPKKRLKVVNMQIVPKSEDETNEGDVQQLRNNTSILHHLKSPFTFPHDAKSNVELAEEQMNQQESQELKPSDPCKILAWDYTAPHAQQDDVPAPPFLDAEIYYDEFSMGSIHLFLWSLLQEQIQEANQNPQEQQPPQQNQDENHEGPEQVVLREHKLIGECYIAASVFLNDPENLLLNNIKDKVITDIVENKVIRTKLWYNGISIGIVQCEVSSKLSPFLRQMTMGVRTRKGIKMSTELIIPQELSSKATLFGTTFPKEIKSLITLREAQAATLSKIMNHKGLENKFKLLEDLRTNVRKMKEILLEDEDKSRVFSYQNPEDLIKSQASFLELAEHLLQYADTVPSAVKNDYYNLLALILDRPEFDLKNIGFDEKFNDLQPKGGNENSFSVTDLGTFTQAQTTAPNDLTKIYGEKIKVGVMYHSFITKALEMVLQRLGNKGSEMDERKFLEFFMVQAFFRIPPLHSQYMSVLGAHGDKSVTIDEWRSEFTLEYTSLNYNTSSPMKKSVGGGLAGGLKPYEGGNIGQRNPSMYLFDWTGGFYQHLRGEEKTAENFSKIQEILDTQKLGNKLIQGQVFFSFITEWIKYVHQSIVLKLGHPWLEIPGYRKLINAFLIELKRRDVENYPEQMITASAALLLNERLLGMFMTILYKKTNVYDSLKVFRTYELIDLWLKTLQANGKRIPSTFDFHFFFEGIFMVMDTDYAVCIAQALVIIYNHYHTFPPESKNLFIQYFFGTKVFKFFLHWSHLVRKVCHHLLLYRFFHLHKKKHLPSDSKSLKKELVLSENSKEKSYRKGLINDYIFSEVVRVLDTVQKAYGDEKIDIESKRSSQMRTGKIRALHKGLRGARNTRSQTDDSFDFSFVGLTSKIEGGQGGTPPLEGLLISPPKLSRGASEFYTTTHNTRTNEDLDTMMNTKKGKKVIQVNKKRTYFSLDEFDNDIPKESIPYVIPAWEEFEKVHEEYRRWLKDINDKEDFFSNDLESIPQIKISIPFDASETKSVPRE